MKKAISILLMMLAFCFISISAMAVGGEGYVDFDNQDNPLKIAGLTEIKKTDDPDEIGKLYASPTDTLYVFAQFMPLPEEIAEELQRESVEDEVIRISEIAVKIDDYDWEVYSGNSLITPFTLLDPDSDDVATDENDRPLIGAATGQFSIADPGPHTIYTYAVDELGNKGPEVRVEFFIDADCPFMDYLVKTEEAIDGTGLLKPAYETESGYYVSPNNLITLDAYDLRSGINRLEYFSIPDGEWISTPYDMQGVPEEPIEITLNSDEGWMDDLDEDEEGAWNLIRCRAWDNVGNRTPEHAVKVYVDQKGPEIKIRPLYGHFENTANLEDDDDTTAPSIVTGVDNGFIVWATDEGSGLRELKIFISPRNDPDHETPWDQDQLLNDLAEEDWDLYIAGNPIRFFQTGHYFIYGRAVDNVGNVRAMPLLYTYVSVVPPTPRVRSGRADLPPEDED